MNDAERNPWKTLSTVNRYENPWFRVEENQVINPAGRPGMYTVIQHKHLAVLVLPIAADGTTMLVGQYRYTLDRYSWELPGGGGLRGTDPRETAVQELAEETGLRAKNFRELLQADLCNGVNNDQGIAFLAWDLQQGAAAPEEQEQLQLRPVPFREAFQMMLDGQIRESMSQLAILRLHTMLLAGTAPEDVRSAIGPYTA